jgi:hypothetical protein
LTQAHRDYWLGFTKWQSAPLTRQPLSCHNDLFIVSRASHHESQSRYACTDRLASCVASHHYR